MLEGQKGADRMNWGNLVWIPCAAAHTAAAVFSTFLEMDLIKIQRSGPWAWAVPGVCLALLALDLTGRLSLRGSGGKMLAALAFPLLCSCGEALILDEYVLDAVTAVWAWVFSLLLLAGYALLGEKKSDAPLDKAEAQLEHGSTLGVIIAVWLALMAGAVLFMSTVGLLLSLIVGGLISTRNGLLDYGGVKGLLLGLLVLYVLQCLWYWRGARLARAADPELGSGFPLIALFVPVWNQVQARRLARRLQLRDVKDCY